MQLTNIAHSWINPDKALVVEPCNSKDFDPEDDTKPGIKVLFEGLSQFYYFWYHHSVDRDHDLTVLKHLTH